MKQSNWKVLLAVALCCASAQALAHEGHDSPGALPAPPHGGKISEAAHSGKHEGGAEEMELFVEAKLQGTTLKLYALGLDPTNTKTWKALNPSEKLSVTEAKVEMPRSKKIIPVALKAGADSWEAEIGSVKERRIFVHATFVDGKEKKQTKIQLEK